MADTMIDRGWISGASSVTPGDQESTAQTGNVVKDLFNRLNRFHPDYSANEDRWKLFEAILSERKVEVSEFLPKGPEESTADYVARCKLARWAPESPLTVRKLLGAMFKEAPTRIFKVGDVEKEIESFVESCDTEGMHLNELMEEVGEEVLGYGTFRILVGSKTLEAVQTPLTRADELAIQNGQNTVTRAREMAENAGIYVRLIPVRNVIDWDANEFGRTTFVRTKEELLLRINEEKRPVTRFIEYDELKTVWWDFDLSDKDPILVGEGRTDHNLGIVPIVVGYFKRQKAMVGEGYLEAAAQVDVQMFQLQSELIASARIHAHPILWVRTNDELEELGIGTNLFVKLQPGDGTNEAEDMGYAQPPATAFEVMKWLIEDRRAAIFRHAGVDPLGLYSAGNSVMEASGVSRAWSFTTSEARILTKLSGIMARTERRIFELVLRYKAPKTDGVIAKNLFKGTIQYPKEFDLSSTDTLLGNLERIMLAINSPTLVRKIQFRIAASMLADATSEDMEKIRREIENNPLLGLPPKPLPGQEESGRMPGIPTPEEEPPVEEEEPEEEAFSGEEEDESPPPKKQGKKPAKT